MNLQLQNQFGAAIRLLQSFAGETVEIDGVPYPCTVADLLHGNLEFVQGGVFSITNVSVCVLKQDLPDSPPINTPAVFRDVELRIKSIDDAGTFWQLLLVQENG